MPEEINLQLLHTMCKEKINMKKIPQLYKNLQQTEMWKIITYWITFLKFIQLECGRDLQYRTEVAELFT